MFAIQTSIKYTEKSIGRYFFWGAIVFVIAFTSVIAYRIYNAELNNVAVVDTVELVCDIDINENDEISIYKLTVAGYLGTGNIHSEKVPPVISQSFDLIANGTIESIENIVLSIHINGSAIQYDIAYAVLERDDKSEIQINNVVVQG